jgi:hypothetical protein
VPRSRSACSRRAASSASWPGRAVRAGARATAVVSLPRRGERLHLRPLHHGGVLRALARDRLLGLARPLAELRATARLRAAGAPVPIPVLVAARRTRGFYHAVVATIHEEDTLDGVALLVGSGRALAQAPPAARRARAPRRPGPAGSPT